MSSRRSVFAAPSTAVIGVRSSCETVAMKSLLASSRPALDGEVAEGVDDTRRAADRDEREPELAAVDVDGQRHRARRRALVRDRDPAAIASQSAKISASGTPEHLVAVARR